MSCNPTDLWMEKTGKEWRYHDLGHFHLINIIRMVHGTIQRGREHHSFMGGGERIEAYDDDIREMEDIEDALMAEATRREIPRSRIFVHNPDYPKWEEPKRVINIP